MGAMLAKRAQRDSKHVRRQIMPTASVGMAPILPGLQGIQVHFMSWRAVIRNLALLPCLAAAGLAVLPGPVRAATSLASICRVKGQEENTLQGLGIVVGPERHAATAAAICPRSAAWPR